MNLISGLILAMIVLGLKKYTKDPIQRSDGVALVAILCSSNLISLLVGILIAIYYANTDDGKGILYDWK